MDGPRRSLWPPLFSKNLNLKMPLRQQRRIRILKIPIQGLESYYPSRGCRN